MIVLIGNTKGGVGKTTVAINVAAARAATHSVWVVDGDRQESAITALSNRFEDSYEPSIVCSLYPEGGHLRTQVPLQRLDYDTVVIDAGGRDSTAMRAALLLADLVVVPFTPGAFDVWALEAMDRLIADAQLVNPHLRGAALLNSADPSGTSSDNADARTVLEGYETMPLLPVHLTKRKAFARAAALGRSVHELADPQVDRKAVAELDALMAAIFPVDGSGGAL